MGFKVPSSYAGTLAGKDPWPLRFYAHVFSAYHFNTLRCRIDYNTFRFTSLTGGMPAGPPPPHFLANWTGSHVIVPETIGGRTFPGPVEVEWTALDGSTHTASVDLDAIFKDRLVLHNVSREEVGEAWLDSCRIEPEQPDILVEVNDRTINVYMRALVVTKHAQNVDSPDSNMRDDVMLAWSRTY